MIPKPPSDLSLHLSVSGDQTVFRQGEIIALNAHYEAETFRKYLLNNRSYDRSGRLNGMEVICIEPGSGTDPPADYFNSYQAFMGGGLFSEQELKWGPSTIRLELNEWRSLPPGSYMLSVVGNRANIGTEKDLHSWDSPPIQLQSNRIRFRVVEADPNWQKSQLAGAVRALDSPTSTDGERLHAVRILRFLGSEYSTRELVRRYWSGQEKLVWDMEAGLFGSPFRATAIREMRAALRAAHGEVREGFVETLVALELNSDPRHRPPQFDGNNAEIRERAFDAYEAERKNRVSIYMADVAAGTFR